MFYVGYNLYDSFYMNITIIDISNSIQFTY